MDGKKDAMKSDVEFLDRQMNDQKLKDSLWSLVNKWNSLCYQVKSIEDRVDALEKDTIKREAKKSKRLSHFALGFSIFTLFVVIFIEAIIKR